MASDGDLELGGLDWTQVIVDMAAEKFIEDFQMDPRGEAESHQFLALEAEQAKRSLSVRPRAAVTVQHEGQRRTYQIEKKEFEVRSARLLTRSEPITRRLLSANGLGWAHVDEVLTTVAVDIGGRFNFTYKGPDAINVGKFGVYDAELTLEFLQKFAMNASMNLHVNVHYGENRHHIHESVFKALGRALRMAVAIDPRMAGGVYSTKGVLE